MINTWWFNVIAYLILYTIFTMSYKEATKESKNDGALTILLQFLSGVVVLLFCPFFAFTFPSDSKVYLMLILACVFYAVADRVNTTARRGLEVSLYSILGQFSTVFMILWGILFFKEAVVFKKILGALLIIVRKYYSVISKRKI